jgi:predicted N-formylglutamate amidohydrolase
MNHAAFEIIGADRRRDWVAIADHATNIVPEAVNGGDLGLPAEDMARHIAWDPGARGVAIAIAKALDGPYIGTRFSRLVIDPNRAEDDPTVLMKLYDGSIIPGNRHADAAEKERRLVAYHRPYHDALTGLLAGAEAVGETPSLISVHSFTPQLRNRPLRPWQIGLLWDRDDRIMRPLMKRLVAEEDICIGDNEPYTGSLTGDCMWRHGTRPGRPHILIEIRNDLVQTEAQQAHWGANLARWITEAMKIPMKETA